MASRSRWAIVSAFVLVCLYLFVNRHDGSDERSSRLVVMRNRHLGASINFIVVGDFGVGSEAQYQVAAQLGEYAASHNVEFVMSTGDQIYMFGAKDVDDPLFENRFEKVYTARSLAVPWYMSVGNHDCQGNVSAQVAYSERSTRWRMPADYYAVHYKVNRHVTLYFLVLNTCSLICKGQYRNMSRCTEAMSSQFTARERAEQYQWLENHLKTIRREDPQAWIFVVGHWALFSYIGNGPTRELIDNVRPLLTRYGVQVYFCGHDHGLQHLREHALRLPHYLASGGGGFKKHKEKAGNADWFREKTQLSPVEVSRILPDVRSVVTSYGFMGLSLQGPDYDRLAVTFVGENGQRLYRTIIAQ